MEGSLSDKSDFSFLGVLQARSIEVKDCHLGCLITLYLISIRFHFFFKIEVIPSPIDCTSRFNMTEIFALFFTPTFNISADQLFAAVD